jgi:predicted hydrolase (HD superfamily)
MSDTITQAAQLLALARSRPGQLPPRNDAWKLLCTHTESASLRGHMLAVEAAMAAYALAHNGDEHLYRLAGLLHDFDYERHPTPDQHPLVGCRILVDLGYPGPVVEAILGHASYTGVARQSLMAKTLFAVDELSGFLTAMAHVRPEGLRGLSYKSFLKKFKTQSFAATINRSEVEEGASALGVALDAHVLFVAEALSRAFPDFPRIAGDDALA